MTTLRVIRRQIWTPLGTGSLAAIVTAILMTAGPGWPGSPGSAAASENLGHPGHSDSLVYLPPCLPANDPGPIDQVRAADAAEPASAIELSSTSAGVGEAEEAASAASAAAAPSSTTTKPQAYIAARSKSQSSGATSAPEPAAVAEPGHVAAAASYPEPAAGHGEMAEPAAESPAQPQSGSDDGQTTSGGDEAAAPETHAAVVAGGTDAAEATVESASDDKPVLDYESVHGPLVSESLYSESPFRDPLYFNDPNAPHRSVLRHGHDFEPKPAVEMPVDDGPDGGDADKPRDKKPKDKDPKDEDPNGEDATGKDPNGDDPNGKDPNGEDPNGEDPNGEDPNGEDPNGEAPNGDESNGEEPSGPAQLIVQVATNAAEIVQISGDGGTNIAEIIQENIQVAFNIQLGSLDELPENLEVYLASLIAGNPDLFPNGDLLGVEVSSSGGGSQTTVQEALNSVVVVQYAGDDGTNIVVIYQLNIQVSVNIQGRRRRCVRRKACPAGPHPCPKPEDRRCADGARSLLWQL